MTARQLTVAVLAFSALSIGITVNAMFFQHDPTAGVAAKAKVQRAAAKAELDRVRALSVDAFDAKPGGSGNDGSSRRKVAVRLRNKNALRQSSQVRLDAAKLPASPLPSRRGSARSSETVSTIQRELKRRGYAPGRIDGVAGLVTRAAIMAFEHDRGAPPTGEPSFALLRWIVLGPRARQQAGAATGARPAATRQQAGRVVRTVQLSLKTLGYQPGKADGIIGYETLRAIKEFELDQGMVPKGRVSGRIVARLAGLIGRRGRLASRRK